MKLQVVVPDFSLPLSRFQEEEKTGFFGFFQNHFGSVKDPMVAATRQFGHIFETLGIEDAVRLLINDVILFDDVAGENDDDVPQMVSALKHYDRDVDTIIMYVSVLIKNVAIITELKLTKEKDQIKFAIDLVGELQIPADLISAENFEPMIQSTITKDFLKNAEDCFESFGKDFSRELKNKFSIDLDQNLDVTKTMTVPKGTMKKNVRRKKQAGMYRPKTVYPNGFGFYDQSYYSANAYFEYYFYAHMLGFYDNTEYGDLYYQDINDVDPLFAESESFTAVEIAAAVEDANEIVIQEDFDAQETIESEPESFDAGDHVGNQGPEFNEDEGIGSDPNFDIDEGVSSSDCNSDCNSDCDCDCDCDCSD